MTASSPPSPIADHPFDCTALSLAELGALRTPDLVDAIEWAITVAAHGEPADAIQEQAQALRRHDG